MDRIEKIENEKNIQKKYRESDLYGNTVHRIIKGDSRKMEKIKSNTIDLIITSPPYFNAKDYIQWNNINNYLEDMKKTFLECFRVLKKGRRFCLNISDIPLKGDSGVKWIPLGAHLVLLCNELGFELADRIIWFKTPLKGFQYGSLPYPPSPLICDSIEYLYILRKPGKPDYSYLDKEIREASKLLRSEYAEYTKQVWTIKRVRLKDNLNGHIAPFPEELPLRCVKLYSFVNDWVLDPFGGSGTTTKVSSDLKRNSVLYEIKPEYIDLIRTRLETECHTLFTRPKFIYE